MGLQTAFTLLDNLNIAFTAYNNVTGFSKRKTKDFGNAVEDTNKKVSTMNSLIGSASGFFSNLAQKMFYLNQFTYPLQKAYEPLARSVESLTDRQRANLEFVNKTAQGYEDATTAGTAFERVVRKLSNSYGISASEIRKAGINWRMLGIGGEDILKMTELSNRISKVVPGMTFESASDAFTRAIRERDTSALSELLGGGEAINKRFEELKVDDLLKKGNLREVLKVFQQISKEVGITDKKGEVLSNTFEFKVKRIRQIIGNFISEIREGFIQKIEPYVTKLLNYLEDPEVQQSLSAIKNIIIDFIGRLVNFGKNALNVFIKLAETIFGIKIGVAGLAGAFKVVSFIGKIKLIEKALTFLVKKFTMYNTIGEFIKKGIIRNISDGFLAAKISGASFTQFVKNKMAQDVENALNGERSPIGTRLVARFGDTMFKIKEKGLKGFAAIKFAVLDLGKALMTSPLFVVPAAIMGIAKITQIAFNAITGESVTFMETLTGILVGGTTALFTGLARASQEFWNTMVSIAEGNAELWTGIIVDCATAIVSAWQSFVDWILDNVASLLEKINGSWIGDKIGVNNETLDSLKKYKEEFDANKEATMKGWAAKKEIQYVGRSNLRVGELINPVEMSAKAIDAALNAIPNWFNGKSDMYGDWENQMKMIVGNLEEINETEDNIDENVEGMSNKERDLRWMKDLAEQRFVNDVNLRQLTPTINLRVSGTSNSPQDYARAIERELRQMADAGTFNAYGDVG